jgi:mediator of RNA polymerase II transcription subunit 13, fungi type
VSSDKSRGELFTFYRKEDLQRDGKSIFNRLIIILRKNECHMSKHAIKPADLLHPDRAKLHSQFISAILCAMRSVVEQNANLIAVGPSTFLFRVPSQQQRESMSELGDTWRLLDLKAQLLPNGQVLVISVQHTLSMFKRLANQFKNEGKEPSITKPSKVLLALSGQYARYTGGHIGKLPYPSEVAFQETNPADRPREAMLQKHRQKIWKSLVKRWLAEQNFGLETGGDDWIEVEVPLSEVENENPTSLDGFILAGKIIWKPIFWPTSFCFMNTMDDLVSEGAELPSQSFGDPLKFVEDWLASSTDRETALKKIQQEREKPKKLDRVEDMDISHNNNIHVDAGQSFRRVTSLDGQGLTTIYPTPPDGPLSHVTPGVVSVDGHATTPGDGTLPAQVDRTVGEVQMIDATGGHVAIGSGLYDEDLFDDVPGRKFCEAEMSDEPNWDFFDEPDADMMEPPDQMDLDIPENAPAAATEDRSPRRRKSEHSDDESAEIPDENETIIEPLESNEIHGSEAMACAENAAAETLEPGAKHPDIALTQTPITSSPPLNPIEVREKIFPKRAYESLDSLHQSSVTGSHRRSLLGSQFDSNAFQPQLKVADNRYIADGLFWFESKEGREISTANPTEEHHNVPRVGIPKKEQNSGVPGVDAGSESPSTSSSAEDSDFDSSEFFSESNKDGSPNEINEYGLEPFAVSPEPEDDTLDSDTEIKIRKEAAKVLELLHPEIREQPFSRNYQPLQRLSNLSLPIGPDNLSTVAQVMVDQISQSFFHHKEPEISISGTEASYQDISGQLQSIYGGATELNLSKFAEIATIKEGAAEGSELAECPPPFIRVSRADFSVDALPTIQPFWETLALQPVSGRKNMTAICIHPVGTHVEERSSTFLQRISQIYSNCNLGTHHTGNIPGMTRNSLIEWEIRQSPGMHGLLGLCEKLGSSLLNLSTSTENVIIYVVNPFKDRDSFADICIAFVALFSKYAKVGGKSKRHELILQIVPMSFIVSPDMILIPSQAEYLGLALEVYNRCPPTTSAQGIAESGAAVTLAEPVPNTIKFSLTSDVTSPLSKDGEILHLAYSQSMDFRWMTACWSDNLGKIALTMTYCLRKKGSSISRPRSDVLKEMWEISADIMTRICGKWQLFVAHEGPIAPEEINEWSFLASQSASTGSVSRCILTVFTFDEHSPIQFSTSAQQTKPQLPIAATTAGKYGTPASTPSAAAMTSSPEQLTASTPMPFTPTASGLITAPTPPDHTSQAQIYGFDISTDPDATLTDPTDESWSLVLPFGLNNSDSSLDNRPSLLSGFLLRRRGPLDSDGLLSLGVNLVQTSGEMTKAGQKALLKELLVQWRGLYLLAKTKNLARPASVLPWHVQTAITGCRAVASVL